MNYKGMGSSAVEGGKEAGRAAAAANPGTPLPLARQLSVYSLTFDEFQSTLGGPGKDFGSMNMDEFLRNIWTAEESQAVASALGATADSAAQGGTAGGPSGLQRQGSLTLPRTLSQKTVDEVWRDLLQESGGAGGGGQGSASAAAAPSSGGTELQYRRPPMLGEMTLEEFLVKAGVVREDMNQEQPPQPPGVQRVNNQGGATNNSNMSSSNNIFFGELPGSSNGNHGIALGFSQPTGRNVGGGVHGQILNNSATGLAMNAAAMTRTYPATLQVGGNVDIPAQQGLRGGGLVGIGDPGMNNGLMSSVVGLGGGGGVTVAAMGSPDGLGKGTGDLSSLSPVPYHMFGAGMRGRKCGGAVEKVVERRQRRMIKNRESAARSRARKQAYTMELEAEVAKLKEQNQELQKKQAEILEMQKNQVLEMINQQRGPKKQCLRRTQTGPW